MDFANKQTNAIFHTNNPLLSGAISGLVSSVILQPLDLIKTRQQQEYSHINSYRLVRMIVREEGVFNLWRGLVPSIIRIIPGAGWYFYTLSYLQSHYWAWFGLGKSITLKSDAPFKSPLWYDMTAAAIARGSACVLLIPISVLKTRMESTWSSRSPTINGSVLQAVLQMREKEGYKSFFRGIVPLIIRDVPFSAVQFGCYSQIKHILKLYDRTMENYTYWNFFASSLAGVVASVLTHPADVVRTRVQLHGSLAFSHLYGIKKEDLYIKDNQRHPHVTPRNTAPHRPPHTKDNSNMKYLSRFSSQSAAADFDNRGSQSLMSVIRRIRINEGWAAFYRGFGPRILKRTLMTSVTWTVFEKVDTELRTK